MIVHVCKVCLCAFIALVVGMVASALVQTAGSPDTWSHPESLWDTALGSALFYVAGPLAVLALIAMFRPTSTTLSVLVAVGWLTIIFAWWAYKPWGYYGEFPWWGFRRHYLGMLPIPLSFGLAFALCTRKLLGPNQPLGALRMRVAGILLLLLLAACAKLERAEIAQRAQTELVGMSKAELFGCAGVPIRSATVDDAEFLTYAGGGDRTGAAVGAGASGVGTAVVSSQRRYCEVTFVLRKGVVEKVNYTGRTGGYASQGEQCAFVVRNCIKPK